MSSSEKCPKGCPPCLLCGVHVTAAEWEKQKGYCAYCALNYAGVRA